MSQLIACHVRTSCNLQVLPRTETECGSLVPSRPSIFFACEATNVGFIYFIVSATCTYVPNLDNLEQQTTEIALVNFLYVSIPLHASYLSTGKLTPSPEGATWTFKLREYKIQWIEVKFPVFCTVTREVL